MHVNPIWSQEHKDFLRKKFALGWNDKQIGEKINRSRKSVESMRRKMKLLIETNTEWAANRKQRTDCRSYSREDDMNILGRYLNGEKPSSIAVDYEVTGQAISNKVERLIDKGIKEVPTPRPCSLCRKDFFSIHSRSVHRRCPTCTDIVNKQGACFLTVY